MALVGAVVVAGIAVLLATTGGGQGRPAGKVPAATRHPAADRFAALSTARTNRCDLGAAELQSMPDRMRLEGSCCSDMDRARYNQQLRDLRRYAGDRLVPRNPYDVPVALAKRLLAYRQIPLSPSQEAIYRRASANSKLGGPCCCPCWRWQAFKGQARFMIARRHYPATRVAQLWELEEGCGGPEA